MAKATKISSVDLICDYCGKEFARKKGNANRYKNNFCCYECSRLFKIGRCYERQVIECEVCGKEIKILESRIKEYKHHYCSRECRAKGYSNEWKKSSVKRNSSSNPNPVFKKLHYCENCGKMIFKYDSQARGKSIFCSSDCVGWGLTALTSKVRSCYKYKVWKNKVLNRDGKTCIKCGETNGLEVHHKKEFSIIIKENNVLNLKDAYKCKELWDIKNGETLCLHCHAEVHPDYRNLFKLEVA